MALALKHSVMKYDPHIRRMQEQASEILETMRWVGLGAKKRGYVVEIDFAIQSAQSGGR